MHSEDYIREKTGLLLVDPYNDFLSPAGKLWPQAKEVAEEVNLLPNLKSIVDSARQSGVRIFFVPITAGNRATTPIGSTRIRCNSPALRTRFSQRVLGAVSGILTLSRRRATLLSRSIGRKAALPTLTSTSSLNSTELKRSSSSACWRTPVSSPPAVSGWNSATTSPYCIRSSKAGMNEANATPLFNQSRVADRGGR